MSEPKFILVYFPDHASMPCIEYLTSIQIAERIKQLNEHSFAIIDGKVVKSFMQNWPIK